ncbi:MAG: NAD(P)H-dependent glycerol-3-phosphate dehydrogenase [Xylanivirga thermophila]|jgi:glycerol-3-phosphate dehydrogenase (NAD(P)+)|uniref:NAD(P)H-dependent glycerol-3-phosphate dehydrogenase n=1 Tax=Xylanivirga thermophila TaxID=2496273 RepID=UPI00101D0A1C|nr:NAD(P)H-dependent glycerol-3-phosphate dehydrogenase [Xylanivirga thermophila]
MKISVLGCGRWGSFLAWYCVKLGYDVMLWGRKNSDSYKNLELNRQNSYLTLPPSIKLTNSLDEAISHGDVIIISISAQGLREFAGRLSKYNIEGKTFVLCMKGIEADTGKRLTEVFNDGIDKDVNLAIWVGPGHVQDYINGIPNCMVIDSADTGITKELVDIFASELIRFYYGHDLIGNEIGAASKNVIGIAAGMLDGFNLTSLKGALMARGTREISRLIRALGGDPFTAYGLCHLGDYEATLFSAHSHNRRFGEAYAKGEYFVKLAEGVDTTRALVNLSKEYNVDLPICQGVYAILFDKREPEKVLNDMFLRSIKFEFWG